MIHNLCTFISCYRVGRSEMLAKARVCNLLGTPGAELREANM